MKNNNKQSKTKSIFNSRSLKYGSNSLILIAAVIGIAVLANVLVSPAVMKQIINKDSLSIDLTPNKLFTLGEQTDEIVGSLNKEVKVYALYTEDRVKSDPQLQEIDEIVKQYKKYSQIKLEYIDIEKNPGFVAQIDPSGLQDIQTDDFVFSSGNKIKKVSRSDLFVTQFDPNTFQEYLVGSSAEQNFTGAIKYVSSDVTPVVYFLEGHDEKKLDQEYVTVSQFLFRNNYDVKTLNLTLQGQVPEDAEIIIAAAPQKDISPVERDLIDQFLKKGGNAVFAFDPIANNLELSNFEEVLNKYNISLNYDIVKETDEARHVKNRPYDIVPTVQKNSVNEAINPDQLAMIMPESRSINILKNANNDINVLSLVKASDKAVGEAIDPSKGNNTSGALDLAAAVEIKQDGDSSKIIVMGNGSFMTDSTIAEYGTYSSGGIYFFLNAVNWLQDKTDEEVIAPKSYNRPQIMMQQSTSNIIALTTVVLLPLLILGAGGYIWMRRRHL